MGIGGIGNIIKMMFAGMIFWFLVKFSFGRNLLIKVTTDMAQKTRQVQVHTFHYGMFRCSSLFSETVFLVPRVLFLWSFLQRRTDQEAGKITVTTPVLFMH